MPIHAVKNQIYESYRMLHPDGTLMCRCNYKKAQWYVKRELAVWEDEISFKLNFDPNGKGKSDNPYYTQSMDNSCVVCGSKNDLNKHHVVPYVFRKRFPVEYKESNHHDIVATCVDCHEKYEYHATLLKLDLAKEHGGSMNGSLSDDEKYNNKIISAKKVIERLKVSPDEMNIPEERLAILKQMADKPLLDIQKEYNNWADVVVENIIKENNLFNFVKMWREHFIKHAQPKNLPLYWNINSPLEISNRAQKREQNNITQD